MAGLSLSGLYILALLMMAINELEVDLRQVVEGQIVGLMILLVTQTATSGVIQVPDHL